MMDTESSSGSPPINSLASKLGSLPVQGGHTNLISSGFKFPPPPRLWGSDGSSESSDSSIPGVGIELSSGIERPRLRSRLRTHKGNKANSHIPIGIFWDIENCQVPKGCSAIDVVSMIRTQFLISRREADFIVVCDVRKETPTLLQELNDAQVSLIHVCGSQKNAADEKLRQCMRRFGELHPAPAALLLISGDINFAADLSDFRHRKNMEVILVHKVNTSPALIACASSNYSFRDLTENLPRFAKPNRHGNNDEDGESSNCELVVSGLPQEAPDRLSRRLKRLADNCGGRVVYVNTPTARMRFPTPENAHRAMKRMDGEDVFGHKITVGPVRGVLGGATYSSDEGYCTATGWQRPAPGHLQSQRVSAPILANPYDGSNHNGVSKPLSQPDYIMNSSVVPPQPWFPPAPWVQPPPPSSHLHSNKNGGVSAPRMIRGAHGNTNLDQSLNSTKGNPDVSQLSFREKSLLRPISPGNSSFSEISSEGENSESVVELTVSNLPTYELRSLHEMLMQLFSKYVIVLKVSVRAAADGPLASVMLYSESDARLAIARIHRRRLDDTWAGRRLELTLGRLSPAPNAVVLRSRLRNLLQDAPEQTLPLVRLSDSYTVRHGCSLTSSDLARVKDTVSVSEGAGRLVKLLNPSSQGPIVELDDAPWKCNMHSVSSAVDENGSRIMSPVFVTLSVLSKNTHELLQTHGGIVPLLSYMDCYAAHFGPLAVDSTSGVVLELLLRNVPGVQLREHPSRHLAWSAQRTNTPSPNSQNGDREPSVKSNGSGSIAPTLAPLLGLLARELIDLLRTAPRCTIPFTRFIPAYHHHFGRQCRVADYGFTRLSELLAALNSTVVVLGTGCSRMITLSCSAQAKRWSGELLRLLRAQPVRTAQLSELPKLYQQVFGRPFSPSDYGICTMGELLDMVTPHAVQLSPSGVLSLPRRAPPPRHHARTLAFAAQALDLLLHTPALRMEFPRFVPAYHMHFGRQCRVAQYGCTKLIELFELIPETVLVKTHPCGERYVHLVPEIAREIMLKRIQELSPISLAAFPDAYAARFGGQPLPDILETDGMEKLVMATGATVTERNGMLVINAPTDPPTWVNAALEACAILTSDRSVNAHGSSLDYFVSAYREQCGAEPPLALLLQRQVVSAPAGRVAVAPRWRAAWRLAGVVAAGGKCVAEIREVYVAKFGAVGEEFDLLSNIEAFMGSLPELFVETTPGQWGVHAGVHVPLPSPPATNTDELMLFATPPGQKGSTVFDTPPRPRWLSPLASTLPSPSAFLPLIQSPPTALTEQKRRTRLAAQFGNAQ